MATATVKKTILKVDPYAKRQNALREKHQQLPLEMLPKTNRVCGQIGHKWSYTKTSKRCTRHLCEVTRPYTPNVNAPVGRRFD